MVRSSHVRRTPGEPFTTTRNWNKSFAAYLPRRAALRTLLDLDFKIAIRPHATVGGGAMKADPWPLAFGRLKREKR